MTDARPNSMRRLDNAIKKMASDEKAYVNIRSLIANAIVGQMIPDGVVKGGTSLKMRFGDMKKHLDEVSDEIRCRYEESKRTLQNERG